MLASSQDACDNQASHVAPQTEALHCKWFIVVVEWCGLQVGILAGTFKSSRWHLLEEKMAFVLSPVCCSAAKPEFLVLNA